MEKFDCGRINNEDLKARTHMVDTLAVAMAAFTCVATPATCSSESE